MERSLVGKKSDPVECLALPLSSVDLCALPKVLPSATLVWARSAFSVEKGGTFLGGKVS